jgi:hypothetical protein
VRPLLGQLSLPRELLTPVMPSTQALVVSLLSRLLFTVGDLGWCAAAVLVRPRGPAPTADAAALPDATADRPGAEPGSTGVGQRRPSAQ